MLTSGLGLLSGQSVRQLQVLDTTVHNVANVDTPGFKAIMLSYMHDSSSPTGRIVPTMPRETVDFRQGDTHGTGNPLDMAVMGKGFFVLETPDGPAYTRDGRFTINGAGELVNLSGYPVMGDGGPVILNGDDITVETSGVIRVDGLETDRLRIAAFDNPAALTRADDGLYFDSTGRAGIADAEDVMVLQRSLERSNVSAIQEMVRLIEAQRIFESYQKVMHTIQDIDKLSTGRIGRMA